MDGSSIFALSLTAAELAFRPFTIVRTHLEILQQSDQLAVSEFMAAALGICVVSQSASSAGIGAIPTPLTELDSDLWLVYQPMLHQFLFASAVGFQAMVGVRYTVDSKAMRKVNNDQDVAVVVEGSVTGEGQSISVIGRMLIKLH